MKIRKFMSSDKKDLSEIYFETALLGESMSKVITKKDILTRSLNFYFNNEPTSIFVLEDKNRIVGYILGFVDDVKLKHTQRFIISIFSKFFLLPFLPKKDRLFWKNRLWVQIKSLITRSDLFKLKHPKNAAIVHINILQDYRKKGHGTNLLGNFTEYAKSKGVKEIHADTLQNKLNLNNNFWLKSGFREYSKVKTNLLNKYYPDDELYIVCYAKKL